jgi:hypothetical protein
MAVDATIKSTNPLRALDTPDRSSNTQTKSATFLSGTEEFEDDSTRFKPSSKALLPKRDGSRLAKIPGFRMKEISKPFNDSVAKFADRLD